ncbi:uncharacterized protein AFUA_2G11910 [Aspergillus fumigatus Af293]|uniref:Uncharacterized protein n=2 Tax=Aspergillus fumigatus TaxID=746128 RepID=Q4X0Y0_ASPFU|nr:hypothetical protein AFUA_2G11910 [Aspergillus fumigatus Af293]EAL93485.1 hypothetical protein AFUA_2G11910 [Aspergillus fumigatus Af293]EDP54704.1 hypothetical protein AFUB_027650 [Aspergillus fumigatus A1163]
MHSLISNPDREEGSANWAQELLILRSCCRCHIPPSDWLQFRRNCPSQVTNRCVSLCAWQRFTIIIKKEKRRKIDEEEEERNKERQKNKVKDIPIRKDPNDSVSSQRRAPLPSHHCA